MAADYTRVHPELRLRLGKILAAMEILGFPMVVTDAVRTVEQQQALYKQGRSIPGMIVTQCDGIVKKSNHQLRDDGWGHAVDCAFLVNGVPSWDGHLPWGAYGKAAEALGLRWGGDWKGSLIDRPHIELL